VTRRDHRLQFKPRFRLADPDELKPIRDGLRKSPPAITNKGLDYLDKLLTFLIEAPKRGRGAPRDPEKADLNRKMAKDFQSDYAKLLNGNRGDKRAANASIEAKHGISPSTRRRRLKVK